MTRIYNPLIETMSRQDLVDLQWRRVRKLVERAHAKSPLWRGVFERAGVRPEQIRSLDDFRQRLPTIGKDDFLADQLEAPPWGHRLMVDPASLAFSFLTSGTSGKGQEVHGRTPGDLFETGSSWATSLYWSGVMPGDTAYHMLPLGLTGGPVSMFFGMQAYGLQVFLAAALDGEARLAMMRRFKPNFFAASALYLRRLTALCQEHGIDPRSEFPQLKSIKIAMIGYEVDWAQEMEDFWGCKLTETYASTQSGAGIASTCEHGVVLPDGRRSMMHFLEHKLFFEVVNPQSGRPAEDGEEGELIVTSLDREASPVLRFATGDKVVFRSHCSCPCGRPFDGIEAGTVARYDSMMKVRGMNFWPEAADAVVFRHAEVDDYNGTVRVADNGREVVELRIRFKEGVPTDDPETRTRFLKALEAELKENTSVSMRVLDAGSDGVQSITYKEKRWKDLRRQASPTPPTGA